MITIPFVRAVSPVSGVCHVMCQSRKQDLKWVMIAWIDVSVPNINWPKELNLFRDMIQEKRIAHMAAYDLIWRLLL